MILLPILQLAAAATIVLSTPWLSVCWACWVTGLAGICLSVWSWLVMGWQRLTMSPQVRPHSSLVVDGPYRFIRHPMYTGLALVCAASIASQPAVWRIAVGLLLALTLDIKARLEERLLRAEFQEYGTYAARTWRFVPPLY